MSVNKCLKIMDEKPRSIWKKSWTGSGSILILSLLIALGVFLVALIYALANWEKPVADTFVYGALVGIIFLTCCLFFLYVVLPLLRWLFWKHWRRTLFGLACLVTMIALGYIEEDWRGKHDWEKFKREWEAKGEKFDFKDFVPPAVPDDQNFAMAPIWVESIKATLGPERSRQWFGDKYAENGRTNFTDRLELNVWRNNDSGNQPTNGNWAKGTVTELEPWQAYYRSATEVEKLPFPSRKAATTNEFPIAPQPQLPAQDVLLALSKYDPAIEELRQASRLPFSRFPLDYDCEFPGGILLPHLAVLKRSTQVLQLRAIAELQNGQPEKALADLTLLMRLTDSIRAEPFVISHLVRIAMFQITLQPVWESLAEHRCSNEQLVTLDAELAKLDFLADYHFAMRSELGLLRASTDYLIHNRKDLWMLFSENGVSIIPPRLYPLIPIGWFYQNQLNCARMVVEDYVPLADVNQETVSPASARHADEALRAETKKTTPYNIVEKLVLPWLGNAIKKFAYAQASVDLARTAIALERYRLVHGEYPESLDTLAPQFISVVPHDVIGGQPLKYRRTANGQFVLYSIGWNETDDGGVVVNQKIRDPRDESDSKVDISQGDWVWRYPKRE
jgi:hypothetical protein